MELYRFGADVLAPKFWQQRFGAETFWRRRFGADTFWRPYTWAPTFLRQYILAPRRFGAADIFRLKVLAPKPSGVKTLLSR